jgi:hypothetical protein
MPYLPHYARHDDSGNLIVCLMLAEPASLPQFSLKLIAIGAKTALTRPTGRPGSSSSVWSRPLVAGTINRVADEVRPISVDLHNELTLLNAELYRVTEGLEEYGSARSPEC